MKKILVPCDFSSPSREAFKVAMDLAAKANSEVIVLHAVYIPVMYDAAMGGGAVVAYDPNYLTQIEEDARKEFKKMKGAFNTNIKASLDVEYGEIISMITSYVESKKIDLIVMGTSGSSGMSEIFIGSNTEKVVRHVPVPVLAVRKATDINSIKKILLPSTLKLDQTNFIHKVKELQEFFHATLHILFVNTPLHFRRDEEAKGALEEFVKHYKINNYVFHFKSNLNEEEGIAQLAQSEKIDLIAMGTHARKGLSHLFNGSITEDVVNHIQCPVWTYGLHK